jgi:amino acid permease
MSTIVGGGMVGIPWAFYSTGFYFAISFSVFASAQVILCSVLFLKARDLCPERPRSMFELGFAVLGRSSIFWISSIILIMSFGLLVIFFSVFGDTLKDFMTEIFWSDISKDTPNFGMKRACWVLSLAVLLLPFTLQKELAELKIVSIGLFVSAVVFVITNVLQLMIRGTEGKNTDTEKSYGGPPAFNKDFIQAVTIIFTACNFQMNLFPIHSNQKDKSLKASLKASIIALLLVQTIYFSLAITGIITYGKGLS